MRQTRARRARRTPAERIGGRYRLAEAIGRGGMATVYRAHDEQLDRPVALKRLRSEFEDDGRFATRFAREARRAGSISHPNVVAIYDVGSDGTTYIVMELVEGGDLSALVHREGPLEPTRAARLAADVAAGLEAAHRAGLVHRDVKPGNVLLTADGTAKVSDFGIARAINDGTLTRTGAILGSVDYFSPEQARGERVTAASDIYALGIVLYELLTGTRPFHGPSPYAIAIDRLNRPPPDPREVAPEVPAGLAEIVRRAMAPEPGDRYPSAREMREALTAWLEASKAGTAAAGPAAGAAAGAAGSAGSDDGERDRRRTAPAWLMAPLLLALLVGGYLGARMLAGGSDTALEDVLPEVIVGSAGGAAINLAPSASPGATSSPSAEPTEEPTPTPTVDPTAVPATPAPATPVPAPADPPPPDPTPAQVASVGPADTVAAFYDHVAAGRFDDAYALWSQNMRSGYERQENLDERFDDTSSIVFDALYTASQSTNAATVQANFTEYYDNGSSQRFIGYWRLIRVDNRWLLDEPTY